jgi:hypothetical protein
MTAKLNVVPIASVAQDFPIEPFEDIVVIEQMSEDITPGGIFLPGDHRKFPGGRVVACGPGRVYSNFMDATGNHQVGHFVPNPVSGTVACSSWRVLVTWADVRSAANR